MDLLTVLMHEFGHLLGRDHDGAGVMEESLAPGERLLPDHDHEPAVAPPAAITRPLRRPDPEADAKPVTVKPVPGAPLADFVSVAPLTADRPAAVAPAVELRRPRRVPDERPADAVAAPPVRVEAASRPRPEPTGRLAADDWPLEENGVWVG
jgi:hypothetical protein